MLTLPVSLVQKRLVNEEDDQENRMNLVAMLQSFSSFQSIACFLEDLVLLDSELERIALSAATINGLLYVTLMMVFSMKQVQQEMTNPTNLVQMAMIVYIIKPMLLWMIRWSPEVVASSFISEYFGYHSFFAPMILGLVAPDGSVMVLSNKLDCFVSTMTFPLFSHEWGAILICLM
ncbi:hypothetical protein RJ641_028595 [Dillenia turbinata]|uniref:Uncharacterized protein n=1 Tax=Dillenia turbinata TaxID=194707 RepID=A0AAN8ZQN4_9MAGN